MRQDSKYKNKKITYKGIVFDSKIELEFYLHLLTKYNTDAIQLQPKFGLQPKFNYHGSNIRAITYIADFMVGNLVYDVKGMETTDFKIKAKMFKYNYPHLKLMLINKMPKKYGGGWSTLEGIKKARKTFNN